MEKNRQLKWDQRYIALAAHIATWSKDPSRQVGAILVRPNNSIASTGFNGFPPGHDDSPELYRNREYKREHVVHAEENAINYFCGDCEGFTLYTSFPCCPNCMKLAGEAGIKRVVGPSLDPAGKSWEWYIKWKQRISESTEIAVRHKIEWVVVVYKLTSATAPIGAKAPAIGGGHWTKTERGWQWANGDIFPYPGEGWTGELILV